MKRIKQLTFLLASHFRVVPIFYRHWSTIAQNVGDCSFKVLDLPKQISYYFRVLAENHLGTSEPLENEDIVFIRHEVGRLMFIS